MWTSCGSVHDMGFAGMQGRDGQEEWKDLPLMEWPQQMWGEPVGIKRGHRSSASQKQWRIILTQL